MNCKPDEIYWVKLRFGASDDYRPCIVLSADFSTVTIVRLSSAVELFNPAVHFWIDSSRPDFAATGLSKTCYADGSKILTIDSGRLVKRLGQLEGVLAADFKAWI